MKRILALLLTALFIISAFSFASCNSKPKEDQWENATYKDDAEIGTGKNTVYINIEYYNHSAILTVHTDSDMLGDILLENKLAEDDEGQYGLYLVTVNNIKAEYEKDRTYWSIYVNDSFADRGADSILIEDGATVKLVYTQDG